MLIYLTEKGLNYYNYLHKITAEMVDEILKLLDEKDIEDFTQSLEIVLRVLRKINATRTT
jgi:DNA-binding MarR family transcriptional regulator